MEAVFQHSAHAGGIDHVVVVVVQVAVLDLLGLHSVIEHLGGVITAQALIGVDAQAVKELDVVGDQLDIDGPVGPSEALHIAPVAQGGEDHLGGLRAGHIVVGAERAVTPAVDDVQIGHIGDVVLRPVAYSVTEGGGHLAQSGLIAAVEHDGDQLGHFAALHDAGGVVGAIVVAVDDAQGDHGSHGLSVDDLFRVGEIVNAHSAGADHHHGHHHDESQSQAESPLEVSHLEFLLLRFELGAEIRSAGTAFAARRGV